MSSYLAYLPAVYRDPASSVVGESRSHDGEDRAPFSLATLLVAFEAVLHGLTRAGERPLPRDEARKRRRTVTPEGSGPVLDRLIDYFLSKGRGSGWDQVLDRLSAQFRPETAPSDFLPWMESLVDLVRKGPSLDKPLYEAPAKGPQVSAVLESFRENHFLSEGLAEILDRLSDYFRAKTTRSDFLPWLASWVALVLEQDWSERSQRDFLARVVPLYQKRGTRQALKEVLEIYSAKGADPTSAKGAWKATISDSKSLASDDLPIAWYSASGSPDTGAPPPPRWAHFDVRLHTATWPEDDPGLQEETRIAKRIIDQWKPAHMVYRLYLEPPTFQIGVRSTLGKDAYI